MMKKTKIDHRMFTGAIIVSAIILFSFVFLKREESTISSNNKSYLEQFSGFNKQTKIKVTYQTQENNIIEKNLILKNENTIQDDTFDLTEPYIVFYSINNQNEHIDIQVTKTVDQIKASFSGIQKSTFISLTPDNEDFSSLIPVDWSGRLELSEPTQKADSKYCIYMESGKNTQEICHNRKRQVNL